MKRFAGLLMLLVCGAVPARATDLAAFTAARDSLQHGVDLGRADRVLAARAAFEGLAAAEPDSLALLYWVTVCDWRATPLAMRGGSRKVAQAICDHGLATAEKVLHRTPRDAGTLALKAGLLGLSLSFQDASAAMTIGPQMVALHAQARTLAPEDPRVAFLDALNTFHMPEFYGGGPARALPKFEDAIQRFEHETTGGPLTATWGHDDALLWAGQCEKRLGHVDRARNDYQRALAINPSNGWVRHQLLPALDSTATTEQRDPH
jgi:tetratricopeptide (TPR) repeat protein